MWCGSRGGQWPHFVGNASFGTGIRSWLRDSTHQLFWVDLRYRISTFGSFCRIVVYGAIDPDVIMTQEALFFNSFQFNLLTRTIFSWEFLTTGHGPLVLQIPQTRRGICVFFCKGKVPKISCCTRSDLMIHTGPWFRSKAAPCCGDGSWQMTRWWKEGKGYARAKNQSIWMENGVSLKDRTWSFLGP